MRTLWMWGLLLVAMGHSLAAGEITVGRRDYYAALSQEDEAHIRYIVNTLADKSPVSLWLFHRRSLEAAGRKTLHIHPLAFFRVILADPVLRRQLTRIQRLPWQRFQKYLVRSFKAAHRRRNLPEGIVRDFSERTGMTAEMVTDAISQEDWEGLMSRFRGVKA